MRRLSSLCILAVALLLLAPTIRAQDLPDPSPGVLAAPPARPCGTGGVWALRGTYAVTATAWQDLSQVNPALPPGYAPVTIIGALKVNGNGEVTGWARVNAGGLGMTAEFVNSQFGAPKADCSFPVSLSMKIAEFGEGTVGPYPYIGVIAGDASALEIAFMMLGTGPGSHVEMDHARRISMNYN